MGTQLKFNCRFLIVLRLCQTVILLLGLAVQIDMLLILVLLLYLQSIGNGCPIIRVILPCLRVAISLGTDQLILKTLWAIRSMLFLTLGILVQRLPFWEPNGICSCLEIHPSVGMRLCSSQYLLNPN